MRLWPEFWRVTVDIALLLCVIQLFAGQTSCFGLDVRHTAIWRYLQEEICIIGTSRNKPGKAVTTTRVLLLIESKTPRRKCIHTGTGMMWNLQIFRIYVVIINVITVTIASIQKTSCCCWLWFEISDLLVLL